MPTELSSEPQEHHAGVHSMSSGNDELDFPYRAISRSAVVAVICGVFAIPGLIQDFSFVLTLAFVGILAASLAIRATSNYPDEYSGRGLAKFALLFNLVLLLGGGCDAHAHLFDGSSRWLRTR